MKALLRNLGLVLALFAVSQPLLPRADAQSNSGFGPGTPAAGTTWAGSEDLGGYGPLTFRFGTDGHVTMIDKDGENPGEYHVLRNGQVTLSFYRGTVVYTGQINGRTLAGVGRNDDGTWHFSVSGGAQTVRQGRRPDAATSSPATGPTTGTGAGTNTGEPPPWVRAQNIRDEQREILRRLRDAIEGRRAILDEAEENGGVRGNPVAALDRQISWFQRRLADLDRRMEAIPVQDRNPPGSSFLPMDDDDD